MNRSHSTDASDILPHFWLCLFQRWQLVVTEFNILCRSDEQCLWFSWMQHAFECGLLSLFHSLSLPFRGFPGGSAGKELACNVGDLCLIPGLGRSPGGGKGSLPQYSCLEHPVDRGTWRAAVHGVSKSQTRLNGFHLGRLTKPPPPLGSEIGPLRLLFWVPPTGNTQGLFFLFF